MWNRLDEVSGTIREAEAALARLGQGLQFCVLPDGRLAIAEDCRLVLVQAADPACWTTALEVLFRQARV